MILTNQILSTYQIIRPHIRRTPIVDVDAADFGVKAARLVLKLESLQHAGSFKARGAFTHLLTRAETAVETAARRRRARRRGGTGCADLASLRARCERAHRRLDLRRQHHGSRF